MARVKWVLWEWGKQWELLVIFQSLPHCLQLQVRVWFQNRRVKYQKQQRLKPPATSAMAVSMDEPSSSSDTNIQREDTESGVDN